MDILYHISQLLYLVYKRSNSPNYYIDFFMWVFSMCNYFHRLFAVLMMPFSTTAEKLAKIRDMEALGRWYANALSPNEAFAGTLKPDYLGFHHNSYYASAYTPHAVHKGALIQYLLSGTLFELSE